MPTELTEMMWPATWTDLELLDDISRREFVIGGAALTAFIAAGCGGEGAAPGSGGSATLESDYPRTVQDANGELILNRPPLRVVALNHVALMYLIPFIDLDTPAGPIELVGYAARDSIQRDIADDLSDVPSYDSADPGGNVELIVSWRPDLAFVSDVGDYYDAVANAVTVATVPRPVPGGWRDTTRMIGDILGQASFADGLVTETDQMIVAESRVGRGSLAIAYVYNAGLVTFQTNGTNLGALAEQLGFEVASPTDPESPFEEVSLELAAERLAVDHVLVLNYGDAAVDGVIREPVLAPVAAIAEQRYTVSTPEFADAATFFGPASARFVLDELRTLPSSP